jgi:hypothetical protein
MAGSDISGAESSVLLSQFTLLSCMADLLGGV